MGLLSSPLLSLKCPPVCLWSSPPSALTCTCPPRPSATHQLVCTIPCLLVTIATSRPHTGWWQVRTQCLCTLFCKGCLGFHYWLLVTQASEPRSEGWVVFTGCGYNAFSLSTQHRRCSRPASHRPVFYRLVACPTITWSTEPTHYKVDQPLKDTVCMNVFLQFTIQSLELKSNHTTTMESFYWKSLRLWIMETPTGSED